MSDTADRYTKDKGLTEANQDAGVLQGEVDRLRDGAVE